MEMVSITLNRANRHDINIYERFISNYFIQHGQYKTYCVFYKLNIKYIEVA